MRWVWRGFAALGIAAAIAGIVFLVVAQVQMYRTVNRLEREMENICLQFTSVDCSRHPDGEASPKWNSKTAEWDFETGQFKD